MIKCEKIRSKVTIKIFVILVFVIAISLPNISTAQKKAKADSTQYQEHSVRKATIYSAVLPGLGQAYNKKYWKIPIIYAGFGVLTYFIVTNSKEHNKFKEAYVYVSNGDSSYIDNDYVDKYTKEQLETGMNDYQRWRDLSYILTGLWYVLNVLDANVDANLFDYDISDDLSLKWEPILHSPVLTSRRRYVPPNAGIRVTLNF